MPCVKRCAHENRPTVLSISWGSAEKFWSQADLDSLQAAFAEAASKGITVVAAAGDSLATAGVPDRKAHVLFPASIPLVLACGGTQIALASEGSIANEEVWHDSRVGTGGGISDIFELPVIRKLPPFPSLITRARWAKDVTRMSRPWRLKIPDIGSS